MDDGASPKSNDAEKNNWFSDFLKKLSRKNADKVTEEEIISMVNEGQETGVLHASEAVQTAAPVPVRLRTKRQKTL